MEKIMKAVFSDTASSWPDSPRKVEVGYGNDETMETLFVFYPSEIKISEKELVGLTRLQALELKAKRDFAFLQHP